MPHLKLSKNMFLGQNKLQFIWTYENMKGEGSTAVGAFKPVKQQ